MVVKTLPIPSTKPPDTNPFGSKKPLRLTQSVSSLPDHRSEQHRLPDATDLRRMCIITKNDLNRLYGNLDRRQRDKDAVRQEIERKNEMIERSAQITKHWPNTIIGTRERKLESKKIREKEEEERKKLSGVEEEKLEAEHRREQIEKAKQLQYYTTDRVRTFHSALLLSEVLKERDMQLEMKKRIAQMHQAGDNDARQRYEESQIEFQKAEHEKIEQKAKERENLAKYHLAQADRRRRKSLEEKEKDREEGEEYRRLAEQYALEQLELERFRKLTQRDVKTMYDKAFDDKQKVKQIEQQMDEEEDEDIRVYAEAKKKITRLKREKELEVHREKQEARDRMIGYLGSLQKRAEADNDTQIFRAKAERQAKELREEQEKVDKQQKMKDLIAKHRHQTMKRHQAEKEMEERENADIQRKKDESDELFLLYQQEKAKQRQQDVQAISQSHLKQVQERKDRQRDLKASEIDEIQRDKHMIEVEKQQYQDYTGRVISYMEDNGRNTYPMKRAVIDEVKRFDQSNQGYKKPETSSNINDEQTSVNPNLKSLDETKKHLGFQWNIPNK